MAVEAAVDRGEEGSPMTAQEACNFLIQIGFRMPQRYECNWIDCRRNVVATTALSTAADHYGRSLDDHVA